MKNGETLFAVWFLLTMRRKHVGSGKAKLMAVNAVTISFMGIHTKETKKYSEYWPSKVSDIDDDR